MGEIWIETSSIFCEVEVTYVMRYQNIELVRPKASSERFVETLLHHQHFKHENNWCKAERG